MPPQSGAPKAFFPSLALCFTRSHPLLSQLPLFHRLPLSTHTLFSTPEHARDAPSCEEMSDVYHPPPSLPNLHTRTLRHTHIHAHKGTRAYSTSAPDMHANTHTSTPSLFTDSPTQEISLVRGVYGIDFCFSLVLVGSGLAQPSSC